MPSDFEILERLMRQKDELNKTIFKMIYDTCKDKTMTDSEKIEYIESICEKLK